MAIDLNRIAAAAVETFLGDDEHQADRHVESRRHRFGGVGALALGVGLGVAARAAYRRVRSIDLERVAGSVENKLSG
jgi:hypothetical protein